MREQDRRGTMSNDSGPEAPGVFLVVKKRNQHLYCRWVVCIFSKHSEVPIIHQVKTALFLCAIAVAHY
jgi:hypothetical protein